MRALLAAGEIRGEIREGSSRKLITNHNYAVRMDVCRNYGLNHNYGDGWEPPPGFRPFVPGRGTCI